MNFPRYFVGRNWDDTESSNWIIFVKVSNERDFGMFVFKNKETQPSTVFSLSFCEDLCVTSPDTFREIPLSEVCLMI